MQKNKKPSPRSSQFCRQRYQLHFAMRKKNCEVKTQILTTHYVFELWKKTCQLVELEELATQRREGLWERCYQGSSVETRKILQSAWVWSNLLRNRRQEEIWGCQQRSRRRGCEESLSADLRWVPQIKSRYLAREAFRWLWKRQEESTCVHIHIHIHICTCTYTYTYVHTHIHMRMRLRP